MRYPWTGYRGQVCLKQASYPTAVVSSPRPIKKTGNFPVLGPLRHFFGFFSRPSLQEIILFAFLLAFHPTSVVAVGNRVTVSSSRIFLLHFRIVAFPDSAVFLFYSPSSISASYFALLLLHFALTIQILARFVSCSRFSLVGVISLSPVVCILLSSSAIVLGQVVVG